jgi:hypothetical protein
VGRHEKMQPSMRWRDASQQAIALIRLELLRS